MAVLIMFTIKKQALSDYKHSLTFCVRTMLSQQRNQCTDCKSAQYCTTREHPLLSPKLHLGPCSSEGMWRGTDTQTCVTNIHFKSSTTHAKCNSTLLELCLHINMLKPLAPTSVRPIREFWEMPITDINARTHPITDTDIRYEGHSVAVARIKRPSVYAATVYLSRSRGGVGRHCPQALGQTVVITSKQASGAKQAGSGRGRCAQASLWV